MRSLVFVMPDKHVVARALLALILGPIAVAGALMLKNPDAEHFVGEMRDGLRVDRMFDQLDILVKAIRRLVLQHPAAATSDLMLQLTQKQIVLGEQIILGRMIGMTPDGLLVVLSPWHTKMTTVNEREAFGIIVPMSQFGCTKTLGLLSASRDSGVSVNGQRLKLPVDNDSATKHCKGQATPDVTFWFTFDADGKL
jgi:hypothetical protein